MENERTVNITNMIKIGGAYASYTIGAGFATGQEVLQFFGSWGNPANFLAVFVSMVMTVYFTVSCYRTGQEKQFGNPSECYAYYCGKYVGYFFDFFCLIIVFGIAIAMFAGCGATINQYFGIPVYIGAILLGVFAGGTVMLGLKKVVNVLGFLGIVIIVYVVVIGIYALARNPVGMAESTARLPEYLSAGKVLRAGVFGIYNPVLSALFYAGLCLIVSIPFLISLGKQTTNQKEALTSGIFSGIFFHAGVLLVLIAILINLDSIIETGGQIPLLSAMQNMIPELSWSFAIILILGIFTTITGYLWLISGRFAEDKSTKSRIITAAVTIAGIFGGAFIPFNQIINILYPFSGLVGCAFLIFIIVKDVKIYSEKKKTSEPQEG
ncbi:hypothetical protein [Sinanaerobacter chloroacetimidivorans]|uniref:Membrane protein YkvI n=1 Tax=Sinanaerobacter chloroacetimidivorans TaxID=2818044 RepID=A0A8J7W2I6_9FIRM|nr:hypothetical protein [Sinanaerobacter chloroacetimidivorans]MBR0598080.1 hypothetical protein [Sinanaerobacter chloroacetimidivorans]